MQTQRHVTKQRKNTSHTFHLIMTIFTAGVWAAFVWLPLTIWHSMGPRKKVVTKTYVAQTPQAPQMSQQQQYEMFLAWQRQYGHQAQYVGRHAR